ncbi:MAG: hypothetical protein WCD76_12420, partial [Pyrinomonadaceae bacterium]
MLQVIEDRETGEKIYGGVELIFRTYAASGVKASALTIFSTLTYPDAHHCQVKAHLRMRADGQTY